MTDALATIAILLAPWALWRTRPRPTYVIHWNSPVVTAGTREELGRKAKECT